MGPSHASLSILGEARAEKREALAWSQGFGIRYTSPATCEMGILKETSEGMGGRGWIGTRMSDLRGHTYTPHLQSSLLILTSER